MLLRPRDPAKVSGGEGGTGHPAGGWMRRPTFMSLCLTASSVTTFTGEPNMCPRCGKRVYFGKAVVGAGHRAPWWHLVALGVCPVVALGGRTPEARRWRGLHGVLFKEAMSPRVGDLGGALLSPLQPRR